MNKKVFLDTNIILDLLGKRVPFYDTAATLFSFGDRKVLKLYISSLTFANIHYILSKQKGSNKTKEILRKFKVLVTVLPVDDKIIELALNSNMKDFEDAIQYFCAIEQNLKVIITRNKKDFYSGSSDVSILTAEEYLKTFLV